VQTVEPLALESVLEPETRVCLRNHALDGVPGLLIDRSTAMRHVGVDRLYFLVYTYGVYVPWLGAIYPST